MGREPFSVRHGQARPKPGRTDEKQRKLIADNRRARFDYEILDTYEAGIQLQGPEVKSLRAGRSSLSDSYATVERGELFLINAYIPEYREANRFNHETRRPRKLLLHRKEIEKLANAVQREGLTSGLSRRISPARRHGRSARKLPSSTSTPRSMSGGEWIAKACIY